MRAWDEYSENKSESSFSMLQLYHIILDIILFILLSPQERCLFGSYLYFGLPKNTNKVQYAK